MVNVTEIGEMGAYVTLLEYDNIEGMILLSELSRRRIRSINKLVRVNRTEIVMVIRVDKDKGKCACIIFNFCSSRMYYFANENAWKNIIHFSNTNLPNFLFFFQSTSIHFRIY